MSADGVPAAVREALEAFARRAASHAPAETQRVEIQCEWYDIGGRKGPALRYLAPEDRELPMPLAFADYIALADSFTEALHEHAPMPLRLSLRTPSGEKKTINVSEDIQNLEQVKKGDRVNIQYYESVAVAMARPGEPSATVQEGSQPMADGTPGRMAGRQTTVTAEIVAVDPTAHTVTLKGPGGETKRVNVQRPDLQQKLKEVKPGQMVQITHTEAMAVSLEKQQK